VLAAALVVAYVVALQRAPKFQLNQSLAEELIFLTALGGLVGARLYHVLSEPAEYLLNPLQLLAVWRGGLSIYGAVLGGLLALAYGVWRYRNRLAGQSLWRYVDWLTPSLLVGQIIGRVGNLFNYELFGYPTSLPWQLFVPVQFRPPGFLGFSYFHPLFLYEMAANLGILFLLLRCESRKGNVGRPGTLFLWYLVLYNIVRFFLEFLRIQSIFVGDVRLNALVSLGIVGIATSILTYGYFHRKAEYY
jgi:phosphatidylglycerol:prolipoprotein diacylglycerol transferase